MSEQSWRPIQSVPEDMLVETKIDDVRGERNHADLIYYQGLYWNEDKTVHVYYTPTHWRHKAA